MEEVRGSIPLSSTDKPQVTVPGAVSRLGRSVRGGLRTFKSCSRLDAERKASTMTTNNAPIPDKMGQHFTDLHRSEVKCG
jgi:hypothetical protein